MSEVKQAGQNARLAEQGSSSRVLMEKDSIWPLQMRSGDMRGLQHCCSLLQGNNLCSQSSIKVEADQQKGLFEVC